MDAACKLGVAEAAAALKGIVKRTPVLTGRIPGSPPNLEVFWKLENVQTTGSFKFRGASNAVRAVEGTVVTHSSGNMAAALARAARDHGKQAEIIMPKNSPQCKVQNVRRYGGNITFCENNLQAREDTCARVQELTGASFVHPYNMPDVICGQGTMMTELLEEIDDLDAVIVPVGGGGMVSGCLMACELAKGQYNYRKKPLVFGAEPLGADDAYLSLQKGQFVAQSNPQTICDGLRTSLGSLTWPIIKQYIREIVPVSEEEVVDGMRDVYGELKQVIEPSAGVGPAVLKSERFALLAQVLEIKKVAVILCGGNLDLSSLSMLNKP